jgi:ubiquinone/menaquinone biosynthesis C-methylase UbiE
MNAAHMEFCGGEVWRQMVYELILPAALEQADLGDDVIEIGPGPGFTTDILCQQVARLTAVEIDPGLADALAARFADRNVEVLRGDATALDLPDNRFSGAASFNMLHHIPTTDQQQQAFAELSRVLTPGGMLVATDAGFMEATVAFHEGDTYNPIEPEALPVLLGDVGFVEVTVRTYDLGWICTARAA